MVIRESLQNRSSKGAQFGGGGFQRRTLREGKPQAKALSLESKMYAEKAGMSSTFGVGPALSRAATSKNEKGGFVPQPQLPETTPKSDKFP